MGKAALAEYGKPRLSVTGFSVDLSFNLCLLRISMFDISALSTCSLSRFLYQDSSLLRRAKHWLLLSALCLLTACGSGTRATSSPTQTPQTVATPTFTPASGTSFASTLSVSIADATSGATIYYTTDRSTPSTSSQVYSAPFTINATTKVNAIAAANGATTSAIGTASYTYAPVATASIISDTLDEPAL